MNFKIYNLYFVIVSFMIMYVTITFNKVDEKKVSWQNIIIITKYYHGKTYAIIITKNYHGKTCVIIYY